VNGLPLVVIELKNPAKLKTDIWEAFNQLQTYKAQIPDLFETNEILVVADGATARFGSLSADRERMMQWRIIKGHSVDPLGPHKETETLVRGLLDPQVLAGDQAPYCLCDVLLPLPLPVPVPDASVRASRFLCLSIRALTKYQTTARFAVRMANVTRLKCLATS